MNINNKTTYIYEFETIKGIILIEASCRRLAADFLRSHGIILKSNLTAN